MLARTALRTIAPRGARLASSAVGRKTPAKTAAVAPSSSSAAPISTTAASTPSTPSTHITSLDGRLKSANRHFHANASESSAGLNEPMSQPNKVMDKSLLRMRNAKDLAGLH